jgi:signal transduction histidine kinase
MDWPITALLAAAFALLLLHVARVARARTRAERAVAFERELAGDLLEQAAGFDRLVAALAGIADDLDEQRVLERTAGEACRLVEADLALVLTRDGQDGQRVLASATTAALEAPGELRGAGPEDAAAALADACAAHAHAVPLGVLGTDVGILAVARVAPGPFTPLELAQLRVLGDFSARAAQNARLFALAETLRDEAEERQRERGRLSDRLLVAEESERRRLALALHDGPQQTMSGIGLMIEAACEALVAGDGPDADRILRLAVTRNREVIRSMRELQFALEPITLRDHGFTAAFGELASQRAEAHGLQIDVDVEIVDRLPRPVQVALYRIAQEALANAINHAGATRVRVSARELADGGIELAIADDGRGVSTDDLDRGGLHRGVDAMRERAAGIGATLVFELTSGGGTTVRTTLPSDASRGLREAA